MAEAAVVARGLSKRFGDVLAVDDLELEVRRNEVFGYLGPNGAGKTTTIRMLLGFLNPTTGSASVLGSDPRASELRKRIGYLPADLNIDPRYTGRELIDFFGSLRGGVEEQVVSGLLARFDLDPHRRVGELSTGNRRKVGIVQALMNRPELLILDEPTSGLDPLLQHEFHQLVLEEVARGATVFLSSHTLPEVEALADRVAILRSGRLVTVSAIDELRQQARQRIDLFVAGTPEAASFEALPEVTAVETHGDMLRLVIEGSAERVIRAAAPLGVKRVVSHDENLEDVFLTYYTDEEG